jgi:hypothetical protein
VGVVGSSKIVEQMLPSCPMLLKRMVSKLGENAHCVSYFWPGLYHDIHDRAYKSLVLLGKVPVFRHNLYISSRESMTDRCRCFDQLATGQALLFQDLLKACILVKLDEATGTVMANTDTKEDLNRSQVLYVELILEAILHYGNHFRIWPSDQ